MKQTKNIEQPVGKHLAELTKAILEEFDRNFVIQTPYGPVLSTAYAKEIKEFIKLTVEYVHKETAIDT